VGEDVNEEFEMSQKIKPAESANHLAVFKEVAIRRTWHNEEWWFAIVNVVAVLTELCSARGLYQRYAPPRQ
jgi:hypothetical protein